MKDKTAPKIQKVRLISGWTDRDDAASEATLVVKATGVHHTKVGELLQFAPETAAERDRLREAMDPEMLEAIASEISGHEHSARAHSLQVIARNQRAALSGQPSPAQRVRDAAPELLAQLQALTVQIEAAGLIVPLKVRAAISSAIGELKS